MEDSGYIHYCSAGETFDSVALAEYGSEKYAADLMCMNPEYCRVTTFCGDEVLIIPVVDVPENELGDAPDFNLPSIAPWKE